MMNMRNLIEQLKIAHFNDYQNVFENNDQQEEYARLHGDFITEDESNEDESVYDALEKEPKWTFNDQDRIMIINSNNDDVIYDLYNGDYENERIGEPDFLFYHFPIHYILICFGFTLYSLCFSFFVDVKC